ncbi:hypothetical protein DVH24_018847 [Malus domestica]|uniref:Uncharacterized protein n=1 Tax=Malus domestica TaxID=3750 RepID=A0A498HNL7_MALDO|nr:hypothetical protein DVH24_018847 [Malus domestica]
MCTKILGFLCFCFECGKFWNFFSVFGFWDRDLRIWSGIWAGKGSKKKKIEDATNGSTADHDMHVAFDGRLVQSCVISSTSGKLFDWGFWTRVGFSIVVLMVKAKSGDRRRREGG